MGSQRDSRSEETIRRRAHEIWEGEGRPEGRAAEHWRRAAAEVDAGSLGPGNDPEEPGSRVGVDEPRNTDEPRVIEDMPGPRAGEDEVAPVASDELLREESADAPLGPLDADADVMPTTADDDTDSPALSDEAAESDSPTGSPTTKRLAEQREKAGAQWPEREGAGAESRGLGDGPQSGSVGRRPPKRSR